LSLLAFACLYPGLCPFAPSFPFLASFFYFAHAFFRFCAPLFPRGHDFIDFDRDRPFQRQLDAFFSSLGRTFCPFTLLSLCGVLCLLLFFGCRVAFFSSSQPSLFQLLSHSVLLFSPPVSFLFLHPHPAVTSPALPVPLRAKSPSCLFLWFFSQVGFSLFPLILISVSPNFRLFLQARVFPKVLLSLPRRSPQVFCKFRTFVFFPLSSFC